jgi:hypothetical protein
VLACLVLISGAYDVLDSRSDPMGLWERVVIRSGGTNTHMWVIWGVVPQSESA